MANDCLVDNTVNIHMKGHFCVGWMNWENMDFYVMSNLLLRDQNLMHIERFLHHAALILDQCLQLPWLKKKKERSDLVKWDASSRWSSSLYCPMRKSDQMTIGKTQPTLVKEMTWFQLKKYYWCNSYDERFRKFWAQKFRHIEGNGNFEDRKKSKNRKKRWNNLYQYFICFWRNIKITLPVDV